MGYAKIARYITCTYDPKLRNALYTLTKYEHIPEARRWRMKLRLIKRQRVVETSGVSRGTKRAGRIIESIWSIGLLPPFFSLRSPWNSRKAAIDDAPWGNQAFGRVSLPKPSIGYPFPLYLCHTPPDLYACAPNLSQSWEVIIFPPSSAEKTLNFLHPLSSIFHQHFIFKRWSWYWRAHHSRQWFSCWLCQRAPPQPKGALVGRKAKRGGSVWRAVFHI